MKIFSRLIADESGATAIEYGLIVALNAGDQPELDDEQGW